MLGHVVILLSSRCASVGQFLCSSLFHFGFFYIANSEGTFPCFNEPLRLAASLGYGLWSLTFVPLDTLIDIPFPSARLQLLPVLIQYISPLKCSIPSDPSCTVISSQSPVISLHLTTIPPTFHQSFASHQPFPLYFHNTIICIILSLALLAVQEKKMPPSFRLAVAATIIAFCAPTAKATDCTATATVTIFSTITACANSTQIPTTSAVSFSASSSVSFNLTTPEPIKPSKSRHHPHHGHHQHNEPSTTFPTISINTTTFPPSTSTTPVTPPTTTPSTSTSPATTSILPTTSLDCQPDNCLRHFDGHSTELAPFCATYTTSPSTATVFPSNIINCDNSPRQVSSACSCINTDLPGAVGYTPAPTSIPTTSLGSTVVGNSGIATSMPTSASVCGVTVVFETRTEVKTVFTTVGVSGVGSTSESSVLSTSESTSLST